SRPVAARATRTADIVASVPLETSRTRSIPGSASTIRPASSTSPSVGAPKVVPLAAAAVAAATISGWAWPNSSVPHEPTRSTYRLPSTSITYAPSPRSRNRGVPPTAPNARTGELTPPGITVPARTKSSSDLVTARCYGSGAVDAGASGKGRWPRDRPGPDPERTGQAACGLARSDRRAGRRPDRLLYRVAVPGRGLRLVRGTAPRQPRVVPRDGGPGGRELPLDLDPDRSLPAIAPVLPDRHVAARRELDQQGPPGRERGRRRHAVPTAG